MWNWECCVAKVARMTSLPCSHQQAQTQFPWIRNIFRASRPSSGPTSSVCSRRRSVTRPGRPPSLACPGRDSTDCCGSMASPDESGRLFRSGRSLRAKFLLVIGFGVVIPLAIVGFWLTRATERSGRALLRARLDGALTQIVTEVSGRWLEVRSGLLDIAEDGGVRKALADHSKRAGSHRMSWRTNTRVTFDPGEAALRLVLRGADSSRRWILTTGGDSTMHLEPVVDEEVGSAGVVVSLPVIERASGVQLGSIETHLPTGILVPV